MEDGNWPRRGNATCDLLAEDRPFERGRTRPLRSALEGDPDPTFVAALRPADVTKTLRRSAMLAA